jgi:hypothetical protein
VLVADRRLTQDGKLVDDESNKAIVVLPTGARLAFAYTGLATAGTFSTQWWLLDELFESLKPDGVLHLERFTDAADKRVRSLRLPPAHTTLTIVFAGYVADVKHAYPALGWVTNAGGMAGWPSQVHRVGDFEWSWTKHEKPNDYANSYCIGAGMVSAIPQRRIDELAEMAKRDKPAAAWVGRAVESIREAADSTSGRGLIGKQCSSIVLSADPHVGAVTDYHTAMVAKKAYMPGMVTPTAVFGGGEIETTDGQYAALPKVGRNQPCPCGSGKKYKRCHARRR